LTAYTLDTSGTFILPLFREYNLTDPRERTSYYRAMNSRASIKARYRNRLINANYPYPWEQDNV
jgi:hypothetical protein